MPDQRVIILDGGYASYAYEESYLYKHGYVCVHYHGPVDINAKMDFCRDAVGILVRGTIIDKAFMQACPQLQSIVRYGVGYDNIDLAAATRHGVRVANVQGYANQSVSDHAIMLMYSCMRQLPPGQAGIHEHFSSPPLPDVFELFDKSVGIIGLGRIGRTFCNKIRSLCAQVFVYDPKLNDNLVREYGAKLVTLQELLNKSHVISLHCDLNDSSFHLLDAKAFHNMTNRPIVINTSRGEVIDQLALLHALNSDVIHSSGLDVFANEPPSDAEGPILQHPRVIATGHYAWYSDAAVRELQRRAVHNLVALLQGKEVEDCLNP